MRNVCVHISDRFSIGNVLFCGWLLNQSFYYEIQAMYPITSSTSSSFTRNFPSLML